MEYDPHLRATMKKIMDVAKKEDVAAYVILVSPSHSEFKFKFPGWSLVSVVKGGIKFRSKKNEFDSDELQHQITENSVHIIMQFMDLCAMGGVFMQNIIRELKKHMKITHEPFKEFNRNYDD